MSDTDTVDLATRLAALEQEVRQRGKQRGEQSLRARHHAELLAGLANQNKVEGQVVLDLDAFTIAQFCKRHGISRATYYVLKKRGLQPDETRVLDRIIITKESAAAWRKKRSAESRRRSRA